MLTFKHIYAAIEQELGAKRQVDYEKAWLKEEIERIVTELNPVSSSEPDSD